MKPGDLYVVGGHANPNRFTTPTRNVRRWVEQTLDFGANVTLVEHAIGVTPYAFSKDEPLFAHVNLVQIRGTADHLLWLQHALYNRGFASLPDRAFEADCGLCWQDTDITHQRPDWAMETLHMLQQHRVGQTWTHSIDFDPGMNVAVNDWGNEVDRSFCAAWLAGEVDMKTGPYAKPAARALLPTGAARDWRSHTGYSWAIRGRELRKLGRLMDWMVTGSGDYHMAHAFAGNLHQLIADDLAAGNDRTYSPGYFRKLRWFADIAETVIQQDIGCVPGIIMHHWHGSKRLRFYGGRDDINKESHFDPDVDIAYDAHGMPFLCGDNRALRDGLRRYNRRRNADCIRVD